MAGDVEGVWRVGNVSIWSWCQFRDALATFRRKNKTL